MVGEPPDEFTPMLATPVPEIRLIMLILPTRLAATPADTSTRYPADPANDAVPDPVQPMSTA
jgi:hypothetical protein